MSARYGGRPSELPSVAWDAVAANVGAFASLPPSQVSIESASPELRFVLTPSTSAGAKAIAAKLTPLAKATTAEASRVLGLAVESVDLPTTARELRLAPPNAPPWPPLLPLGNETARPIVTLTTLDGVSTAAALSGDPTPGLDDSGMGGMIAAVCVLALLLALAVYCLLRCRRRANGKQPRLQRVFSRSSSTIGEPSFSSVHDPRTRQAPDYTADIELQQPAIAPQYETNYQHAYASPQCSAVQPLDIPCDSRGSPLAAAAAALRSESGGQHSPSHRLRTDDDPVPPASPLLPFIPCQASPPQRPDHHDPSPNAAERGVSGLWRGRRRSSVAALWEVLMRPPTLARHAPPSHPQAANESVTSSSTTTTTEPSQRSSATIIHGDPFPTRTSSMTPRAVSSADEPPAEGHHPDDPFPPSRSVSLTSVAPSAARPAAAKGEGKDEQMPPSDYQLEKEGKGEGKGAAGKGGEGKGDEGRGGEGKGGYSGGSSSSGGGGAQGDGDAVSARVAA